jgi:hypothetical protein
MVRGELGKADKLAECCLSLDFGDSGVDAVGGIVAPIVQNMQRGFELSGDGRSRFADDVGGDAGTAARVLVRFEQAIGCDSWWTLQILIIHPPIWTGSVNYRSDVDCLSGVRTRLQCAGLYISGLRVDVNLPLKPVIPSDEADTVVCSVGI